MTHFNHRSRIVQRIAAVVWKVSGEERPSRGRIPVLCYHRVLPNPTAGNGAPFALAPEQFESQMVFLVENEFRSLSLQEYREMAQGRRPIESRCVLVTFDDGYADSYSVAWPIARRHGVRMNLFILTALSGAESPVLLGGETPEIKAHVEKFRDLWRPLNWRELRTLRDFGIGIGLHGHRHVNLPTLDKATLDTELSQGCKTFERELGERPWAFALPYGRVGSYTPHVLEQLRLSGLELVFSALAGRTRLPFPRQPCCRLIADPSDDLHVFSMKLFGAYDWLGQIRRCQNALLAL